MNCVVWLDHFLCISCHIRLSVAFPSMERAMGTKFLKEQLSGTGCCNFDSADGEYRYDDGTSTFTFHCDGKNRPTKTNRTRAGVKSNASALDVIQKENGVKTNVSHWGLSDWGQALAVTATAIRPTGPVVTANHLPADVGLK